MSATCKGLKSSADQEYFVILRQAVRSCQAVHSPLAVTHGESSPSSVIVLSFDRFNLAGAGRMISAAID
jgi:hypothetical protein